MTDDVTAMRAEVGELRAEVRGLRAEVDELRAQVAQPGAGQGSRAGADRFAGMYDAFQDAFRGAERDVAERLSAYLPDIQQFATGRRVLDVGPGRGEWLALLAEHGIPAYGVEANAAQVNRLRQRPTAEVVHADAVAHLRAVPAGSLDAVTAFHVVEHLQVEDVLELLSGARRALRPGGGLLLETPNPTNLVMGACNFWLDPTHLRPLPPRLTSFLVSAAGFTDVQVRLLHPREREDFAGLTLDGVPSSASALAAEALRTAIYGPQDYAVIACTPHGESDGDEVGERPGS